MSASVRERAFFVFVLVLFLAIPLSLTQGQIRGVPASVSSIGFGGSTSFTPGVAASVTSLGPNGFGGRFSSCCTNAFSQNPAQHQSFFHGRHGHHAFFPVAVPVYTVPYTQVIVVQPEAVADDDEDYQGGPTIFDRRGNRDSRARARHLQPEPEPTPQPALAAAPAEPVKPQPSTLLVFRDGHQFELQNYAIVGDTLFDLAENRTHKILLADLDLPATRKVNEDRGVDFQVPAGSIR